MIIRPKPSRMLRFKRLFAMEVAAARRVIADRTEGELRWSLDRNIPRVNARAALLKWTRADAMEGSVMLWSWNDLLMRPLDS